jgi:hypothetical protein
MVMATYLADRVVVYSGTPSVESFATKPESLLSGLNKFLKSLDITFRRDPVRYYVLPLVLPILAGFRERKLTILSIFPLLSPLLRLFDLLYHSMHTRNRPTSARASTSSTRCWTRSKSCPETTSSFVAILSSLAPQELTNLFYADRRSGLSIPRLRRKRRLVVRRVGGGAVEGRQ